MSLEWLERWPVAVAVAIGVHLVAGLLPVAPDPGDPQEYVEFELAEVEPPPEPEPIPDAPPGPPDEPEEVPPEPSIQSNRPAEADVAPEDVPLRTGLALESNDLVEGGMAVRVGNTTTAGFDAEIDPDDLRGFSSVGEPGGGGGGGGPVPTTRADLVRAFQPSYPKELVEQGIEGRVLLDVVVLPTGRAGRVSLVRGVHPELDALAIRSVRRFRWNAARYGRTKVASTVKVAIDFRVRD